MPGACRGHWSALAKKNPRGDRYRRLTSIGNLEEIGAPKIFAPAKAEPGPKKRYNFLSCQLRFNCGFTCLNLISTFLDLKIFVSFPSIFDGNITKRAFRRVEKFPAFRGVFVDF
jgi:hypothetical protein